MSVGVDRLRLAVGLVVAPLVVVPLTFGGYAVLNLLAVDGFRGDVPAVWSAASNFALATLVGAYVIQAAVGAPISLFLARSGRFSLGRMLVIGMLCGALPFVISYSIAVGGHREASTLVFACIGAVFGAAIAAVTYAFGRDRRGKGE